MTRIHLPEGSRLAFQGAQYKVVTLTENQDVHLSSLDTGEPLLIPSKEIAQAVFDGEVEILSAFPNYAHHQLVSFDSFSDQERAEARARLEFVRHVDKASGASNLNQAVSCVIRRYDQDGYDELPSKRTLMRWYKSWILGGKDIRALLPRNCFKGPRQRRFDNRLESIIWEIVHERYLKPEYSTGTEIYRAICRRIKKENQTASVGMKLKAPSRRTIYRYLSKLDPYEVLLAHHGQQVADQKFGPVGSGIGTDYPLERVEIDHHLIDLLVVYPNGDVMGRVWLTLAIDSYSRMVVGFDISPEPPSYRSIMRCLRNAIAPKDKFIQSVVDEFKAQSGNEIEADIENEWPCFGLIVVLVVDNGLEFHSQNLLDALSQLGISIEYNPKRTPRYKGKVERFFQTLNSKLIHTLDGTTFSNTQQRGDYASEKNAKLTIQDLMLLVTKFVVDEYSNTYHEGIKDCPIHRWTKGTEKHPVRLLSNLEDLSVLTSCVETCTLSRIGVRLFNLQFQSEAIQLLYRRLMTGRMNLGRNPKVRVKYDPENLLLVYVEDAQNRIFLPASCVYASYADGLSVWRHKLISRVVSNETNGARKHSEEKLLNARVTTFELAQQLKTSKRKTQRNKAHRYVREEVIAEVVTNFENASEDKQREDIPVQEYDFSSDEIAAELERADWKSTSPSRGTGGDNA